MAFQRLTAICVVATASVFALSGTALAGNYAESDDSFKEEVAAEEPGDGWGRNHGRQAVRLLAAADRFERRATSAQEASDELAARAAAIYEEAAATDPPDEELVARADNLKRWANKLARRAERFHEKAEHFRYKATYAVDKAREDDSFDDDSRMRRAERMLRRAAKLRAKADYLESRADSLLNPDAECAGDACPATTGSDEPAEESTWQEERAAGLLKAAAKLRAKADRLEARARQLTQQACSS